MPFLGKKQDKVISGEIDFKHLKEMFRSVKCWMSQQLTYKCLLKCQIQQKNTHSLYGTLLNKTSTSLIYINLFSYVSENNSQLFTYFDRCSTNQVHEVCSATFQADRFVTLQFHLLDELCKPHVGRDCTQAVPKKTRVINDKISSVNI